MLTLTYARAFVGGKGCGVMVPLAIHNPLQAGIVVLDVDLIDYILYFTCNATDEFNVKKKLITSLPIF